MKKLTISILAGLLVLAPLAAHAGEVQNRINHQQYRIYQGIKNGSISPREDRQLERRESTIEAARNRDLRLNYGRLTRGEKHRLNQRLNRLSNTIYRDKHN